MPRRDGTGPEGFGPLTGRGRGFCGFGRGRGFGYGPRFYQMTEEEEKGLLEAEREALKKELEMVEFQLGRIDKK